MNALTPDLRRPSRPAATRRSGTTTPATHCVGIVTDVDTSTGRHTVASGQLLAIGRRATSCLLEPAVGDSVACLIVAPDEFWIIAILQREEGVENRLRCDGATRFEVAGTLSLQASELELRGAELGLRADRINVTTDEAVVVGRSFRLLGNAVSVVGALLSTVFDRVSHFSKHHQRTTDGIDKVQANYVEQDAREVLRLSGQTTLITGATVVKASGGQIHLGQ